MTAPITVQAAALVLRAAGVPSPERDAQVLLRLAQTRGVDVGELVAARSRRVPLQHLVGSTGFRYLDVLVGPGVFVPRPETELVVEAALAAISGLDAPLVVDLCAGTGAVGLSIVHEHRGALVHLVELDSAAVVWLDRNLASRPDHETSRATVHHGDVDSYPVGLLGEVDLVVSNPPYVPVGQASEVDPEVRHDPDLALWGGVDGLDVIRRLVPRAAALLGPGGTLVVEHSESHEAAVPDLVRAAGFTAVACHPDLTGRPRYTTARRTGPSHP